LQSFCQAFWEFLWFLVTGLFFRMFSASFYKKISSDPLFSRCSQLWTRCRLRALNSSCRLFLVRLGMCGIIQPFLFRVGGSNPRSRARSSVGVLALPLTARASPARNAGRAVLRSSPRISPRRASRPADPRHGRTGNISHTPTVAYLSKIVK